MFSAETYEGRRKTLAKVLGSGRILLLGNQDTSFNYRGNPYPFRQDSTFLYYAGIDLPGLAIIIDITTGKTTLYGHEWTIEDTIWIGPQVPLKDYAASAGIYDLKSPDQLASDLNGGEVHYLPPSRGDNTLRLTEYLNRTPKLIVDGFSEALINAVVDQRSYKTEEEIEEMVWAVSLSGQMHVSVMREAAEGLMESDLSAIVRGMCESEQVMPAYGIILSADGQTLHNHYHGNDLRSGQLILGDFGAESPMHYAGDITRTFPVDRFFTGQQREIYEIVLKAEEEAIMACKAGVKYRDIHLFAAGIITRGLKDLGIMKGDVDEAVAAGAHALFFPHGLGHMIGLDVHDMEDLGENYVGYGKGVTRSDQFGLAYLRLARELEPGFVLTVEPGIYFIPELMDQWAAEKRLEAFINYDALEDYRDFGGIRIEDNVLITEEEGAVILGEPIPKSVEEIEALRYEV